MTEPRPMTAMPTPTAVPWTPEMMQPVPQAHVQPPAVPTQNVPGSHVPAPVPAPAPQPSPAQYSQAPVQPGMPQAVQYQPPQHHMPQPSMPQHQPQPQMPQQAQPYAQTQPAPQMQAQPQQVQAQPAFDPRRALQQGHMSPQQAAPHMGQAPQHGHAPHPHTAQMQPTPAQASHPHAAQMHMGHAPALASAPHAADLAEAAPKSKSLFASLLKRTPKAAAAPATDPSAAQAAESDSILNKNFFFGVGAGLVIGAFVLPMVLGFFGGEPAAQPQYQPQYSPQAQTQQPLADLNAPASDETFVDAALASEVPQ